MSSTYRQSQSSPYSEITPEELHQRIVDALDQEELLDILQIPMEELVYILQDEIWEKRKRFWRLYND